VVDRGGRVVTCVQLLFWSWVMTTTGELSMQIIKTPPRFTGPCKGASLFYIRLRPVQPLDGHR
jgi:hypothetical protein